MSAVTSLPCSLRCQTGSRLPRSNSESRSKLLNTGRPSHGDRAPVGLVRAGAGLRALGKNRKAVQMVTLVDVPIHLSRARYFAGSCWSSRVTRLLWRRHCTETRFQMWPSRAIPCTSRIQARQSRAQRADGIWRAPPLRALHASTMLKRTSPAPARRPLDTVRSYLRLV